MSTRLVSISPTVSTKANSGARQAQPRSGKFAMCAVAMPTRTIAQIAMAPMENSTLARPCVKAKARSRRSTTPVSSAISTSDRESRRNAGGSSNRHSIVCCGKKVAIELKVGESSPCGKTNEPGTWHGRCPPSSHRCSCDTRSGALVATQFRAARDGRHPGTRGRHHLLHLAVHQPGHRRGAARLSLPRPGEDAGPSGDAGHGAAVRRRGQPPGAHAVRAERRAKDRTPERRGEGTGRLHLSPP